MPLDRLGGVGHAVETAVREVGRDDAVEEGAVAEHEAHGASGARVGEGGVVHERNFEIDEAAAADGAYRIGVLAVENGRETGDIAFCHVFKHEVGAV